MQVSTTNRGMRLGWANLLDLGDSTLENETVLSAVVNMLGENSAVGNGFGVVHLKLANHVLHVIPKGEPHVRR